MKGDRTTDPHGHARTRIAQTGLPPELERTWSLRIAQAVGDAAVSELSDIAHEFRRPVSANVAVSGFMTALNQLIVEASALEDRPEIWADVKSLIDQIVAGEVM